jgi:hypothetical protein
MGAAWERHGMCELTFTEHCKCRLHICNVYRLTPEKTCACYKIRIPNEYSWIKQTFFGNDTSTVPSIYLYPIR